MIVALLGYVSVSGQKISDAGAAREYCDTTALQRIEGIWEMTTKECSVLISRDGNSRDHYIMTVIDSRDARILPGTVIGNIETSADPNQFLLTMKGDLKLKIKCLATLSSDDMALHIEKPRHRLKFSPTLLLSRFWRLFRYESDSPAERIKNGLIRLYPRGINNQSNDFRVKYL